MHQVQNPSLKINPTKIKVKNKVTHFTEEFMYHYFKHPRNYLVKHHLGQRTLKAIFTNKTCKSRVSVSPKNYTKTKETIETIMVEINKILKKELFNAFDKILRN